MRTLLLTLSLTFVLSHLALKAQTSDYYISAKGDTVKGEIHFLQGDSQFNYKNPTLAKVQKISVNEAVTIAVGNRIYDKIKFFTTNDFQEELVERIILGDASLYRRRAAFSNQLILKIGSNGWVLENPSSNLNEMGYDNFIVMFSRYLKTCNPPAGVKRKLNLEYVGSQVVEHNECIKSGYSTFGDYKSRAYKSLPIQIQLSAQLDPLSVERGINGKGIEFKGNGTVLSLRILSKYKNPMPHTWSYTWGGNVAWTNFKLSQKDTVSGTPSESYTINFQTMGVSFSNQITYHLNPLHLFTGFELGPEFHFDDEFYLPASYTDTVGTKYMRDELNSYTGSIHIYLSYFFGLEYSITEKINALLFYGWKGHSSQFSYHRKEPSVNKPGEFIDYDEKSRFFPKGSLIRLGISYSF